ncbi:MAG: hypothetical protein Q9171_007257 [Xanthocarpia ochracea]
MPRDHSSPVLFSLKPHNAKATEVVNSPYNEHLLSRLESDGSLVLDVHFPVGSGSTLAALGRGYVDIMLNYPTISRLQCTFEVNLASKVVMLYDRSVSHTTQIHGTNQYPFEHGRPIRRVVVMPGPNQIISMGGHDRRFVSFEIVWHHEFAEVVRKLRGHNTLPRDHAHDVARNPHKGHTVEEAVTVLPSRMMTRIHTSSGPQPRMRYIPFDQLGAGAFGTVYKAIDVDTGNLMAVKIIPRQAINVKRGIGNHARLIHPHIVRFIFANIDIDNSVQSFIELKSGSLESLLRVSDPLSMQKIRQTVLREMLEALDFLASKAILHRDVKPANILYDVLPDPQSNAKYQFLLADFGLCNQSIEARSQVGTQYYMAPEIYRADGYQTPKIDVWSLFVTMMWTLDADGFRRNPKSYRDVRDFWVVVERTAADELKEIRHMARLDHVARASAAQMLVEHYGGNGLSSSRSSIPALIGDEYVNTTNGLPTQRPFVPSAPRTRSQHRADQRNRILGPTTDQNRIEKRRVSPRTR